MIKAFSFFVVLLVFCLMLGCTQEQQFVQDNNNVLVLVENSNIITDHGTSSNSETPSQNDADLNLLTNAVAIKDANSCGAISSVQIKDACFYRVAVVSNSKEACSGIVNSQRKAACEKSLA